MDLGIAGRRALVTGVGRGLGRSIATCLAREGVVVSGASRTQADLDSLRAELPGEGHRLVALDLAEEGAPARLLDEVGSGFDIVVHNLGGTLDLTDPFAGVADWRRVWRFNLEVAIELNLALLPPMQKQKWGRVVHVSSISGAQNDGPVPYCAVKAALNAYVRSMGRVVSADNVILTSVLPGAVFTEGGYWDWARQNRPEHVEKYLAERMASHRFGRPDEIGNAVAFLCSEHASFFVGSIVPIDGGQGRNFSFAPQD